MEGIRYRKKQSLDLMIMKGTMLDGEQLFFAHVHLHGGPAPVRGFLPQLIDLVWNRKIDPGKVFDLQLPLAQVAGVTARWTNVARSKRCCARNRGELSA
jgi:hypothetical protein